MTAAENGQLLPRWRNKIPFVVNGTFLPSCHNTLESNISDLHIVEEWMIELKEEDFRACPSLILVLLINTCSLELDNCRLINFSSLTGIFQHSHSVSLNSVYSGNQPPLRLTRNRLEHVLPGLAVALESLNTPTSQYIVRPKPRNYSEDKYIVHYVGDTNPLSHLKCLVPYDVLVHNLVVHFVEEKIG